MDLQMIGIRMGTSGSNLLPNLSLDFAETKALDPRITFTRASSGTYWDENSVLQTAAVDEPRFTHNPATGESLGLLVEGAATNLQTYSDALATASFIDVSISRSNDQITAPDGNLTGTAFIPDNATGRAATYRIQSATGAHTWSVYAKQGEFSWAYIRMFDGVADRGAWFDLSSGDVGTVEAGTTAAMQSCGSGWYRISVSTTLTGADQQFGLEVCDSDGVKSATGDGAKKLYYWRAQLETGSIATSPIKTEASTVTRAADVATMTGTNFSDWYNASEGAFYVQCVPAALSVGAGISANDNTTNERIRVAAASTTDQATVTDGGADQAVLDGGTPVAGSALKLAMSYKANDFALSLNGGTVATDTGGTIPTVTQLQLGAETTTTGNLTIAKLSYYPRSLPDAQLQVITA